MQIQLYRLTSNNLVDNYVFYDPVGGSCFGVPFINEHVIAASVLAVGRSVLKYFNPTKDGTLLLTFQSNEVSLLLSTHPELFI